MRTTLAVFALLSAPVLAFGQAGMTYTDGYGHPLLFGEVVIPVYDENGHLLHDPTTGGQPVTATYCFVASDNKPSKQVDAERVSDSDQRWVRRISYTLDMERQQLIVTHVWTLATIATPGVGHGYRVITSPGVVGYATHIVQPLSPYRPGGSHCDWDQILANLVVTGTAPSGGGGSGVMSCQWRYDSYVHNSQHMHLECP